MPRRPTRRSRQHRQSRQGRPAAPGTLASGYVGPDGIAQIANIIGLKFASETGEDSEVQSAIAGILPQLVRGSVTDITWTATKTEQGIEDKYSITMPPDVASVFNETIKYIREQVESRSSQDSCRNLPALRTIYNFKDPQVAWR